jgi:hypothetical protein
MLALTDDHLAIEAVIASVRRVNHEKFRPRPFSVSRHFQCALKMLRDLEFISLADVESEEIVGYAPNRLVQLCSLRFLGGWGMGVRLLL